MDGVWRSLLECFLGIIQYRADLRKTSGSVGRCGNFTTGFLKGLVTDPSSLAPDYTGKTCIGNFIKGTKNNEQRAIFIYNTCDHAECYEEVESQAISYTAGVPPVAAAILVARGDWDVKHMVNVEELDPKPFIELLDIMGLPTVIVEQPTPFISPVIESLEAD